MKRVLPSTSHEANRRATDEMREAHHAKIIAALQKLGVANYETIGAACGLERHAIGRRLSELERKLTIFKPGTTSLTKSGRKAMNYCLTSDHTQKTDQPVTYKKEIKNSSDYSKELINSTKQQQLF